MNKDVRIYKDNSRYVYGYFPLGSSKVSTSPHVDIIHDIRAAGVETFVKDGILHFATPINSCDLPIDLVSMQSLLSSGLYVQNLPMGAEMPITNLAQDTPAGLPASTKLSDPDDPQSATVQKTWQEWFDGQGNNNVPAESIDPVGDIAFGLRYGGKLMNSNDWLPIIGAGITIMTNGDFKTLLSSSKYTMPE